MSLSVFSCSSSSSDRGMTDALWTKNASNNSTQVEDIVVGVVMVCGLRRRQHSTRIQRLRRVNRCSKQEREDLFSDSCGEEEDDDEEDKENERK